MYCPVGIQRDRFWTKAIRKFVAAIKRHVFGQLQPFTLEDDAVLHNYYTNTDFGLAETVEGFCATPLETARKNFDIQCGAWCNARWSCKNGKAEKKMLRKRKPALEKQLQKEKEWVEAKKKLEDAVILKQLEVEKEKEEQKQKEPPPTAEEKVHLFLLQEDVKNAQQAVADFEKHPPCDAYVPGASQRNT